MTDTSLTVADLTTTQQNELIARLMQEIVDMKNEMKRTQEPADLAITANLPGPDHERPSVHFPSPDPSHQPVPISTNPPTVPVQASPIINLTTLDAGPSHVFSQNPHNSQANSTSHIAHIIQPQAIPPESQAPDKYNPPATQTVPPKVSLNVPIFDNPHICHSTYPEVDYYKGKEKEWKAEEEMARLGIKEEIAKAMKQFHYTPDVAGLDYENLCIHPELSLPDGFKIPKFDTFDGNGNPLAHLRAYCDQLVGVGKNEALLMRLFSRSLSGEALEWFTSQETSQWANWGVMTKDFVKRFAYNVEIVPDRYSLERIKQKSTESYREYAYRWRKNAARVRPPMSENEIIEVFVRSQEPEFYERMMLLVGVKFADIVKIGENIEDGLKMGKVTRMSSLAGASGMLGKRKEDVSAVSGIQGKRRTPSSHPRKSTPPRAHFQSTSQYHPPHPQSTQYLNYQPPPQQNNYNPPRPNANNKTFRVFTPLVESQTKLFERLSAVGLIQPAPPRVMDVNSRFFRGDQTCAYHSNSTGHNTEDCISLKHKIQDLIDRDMVVLQTVTPNVNNILLPDHDEA